MRLQCKWKSRDNGYCFPTYMNKKLVFLRIGGVLPEIWPEWLAAGALADANEPYEVMSMSRTETVPMWGYGKSTFLHMDEKDSRKLPDELSMVDGRRINVIVRGRQPLCPLSRMRSTGAFKEELSPSRAQKCGRSRQPRKVGQPVGRWRSNRLCRHRDRCQRTRTYRL